MQTADSAGNTFVEHPNGQRTHIVVDDDDRAGPGARETVLIQHGFCRTAAHWQHWAAALVARGFRVVRRDLRGHGLSSYPLADADDGYDYSLDTLLLEMVQTLDALGVARCHFIGESTSGMLGEAFAARHPQRLLSLTVIAAPTHLPPPALELFAFGHTSWPAACRAMGARGWAEALASLSGTVASPDPAALKAWLDLVAVSSSEGLAGYAQFLSTLDARPYLKDIDVPMLILAPANSAATTLPEQRALAEQVAGARLEVVNGRGHEIYVEMAEDCQRLFFDFVDGLGGLGVGKVQ
ncbi:alpha/beta-hydrolase [Mytilinidion resinicola]|uniref:Alpha/beta-hydrolase n=1 Tax=Mytilinidion resinicola TaxID=574789 RepID=A0A6A6YKQ8_9PEZI|nr:alpha/beta-hydrolase [Mytilinidion resinicola]KAF2809401.1 alpha/beta-hydrolase [Mytilinidion resinicola]